MRTFCYATVSLVAILAIGCAPKTATPPTGATAEPAREIEIDAPGVKVEAGGGKGVEVEAPGVDVEVPKEEPK
jgi:hypothetical protein